MTTSAKSGFGTTITWDSNAVGECKISGPEPSADELDATTNSSTSGWKEYIAGLKDGGEVTLEGNYVPADVGQAALRAGIGGSAATTVITLANSLGTVTFSSWVKSFKVDPPYDGIAAFSCTLRVTGAVSY